MRVLVTAASKHGATLEIAQAIARELEQQDAVVEHVAIDDVSGLDGYDAVVLGSAVYMGRWLEPARELVRRHADDLAARPTWLFSSGPVGDPPRPEEDEAVDVRELVEATQAVGHRLFAGRIDRRKLGFAERAVLRAVGAKEGDYRDGDAIRDWAAEIGAELTRGR
jgi:menaquinone-dependent protoporphyrinogen oxidase